MTLHTGDSAEVLKQYPDNHFDSIVTDPPYGIEFLAKEWDKNTGPIEVWRECLRVLKPGGHLLAFSAARKYHRLATNLEDIGFEIRDQIMWIYGSGFPKGQDMGKRIDKRNGRIIEKVVFEIEEMTKIEDHIYRHNKTNKIYRQLPDINGDRFSNSMEGKKYKNNLYEEIYEKNNEWAGWKTGLKPAHEPIVMARKPFKGSTIDNVLKHRTGAINIDDTRVVPDSDDSYNQIKPGIVEGKKHGIFNEEGKEDLYANRIMVKNDIGRYPSNVIMSEEEGKVLDSKTGIKKYGNKVGGYIYDKTYNVEGFIKNNKPEAPSNYGDGGGPSKYYYCPKVSRKERHIGIFESGKEPKPYAGIWGTGNEHSVHTAGDKTSTNSQLAASKSGPGNNHPTVKPVALMKYLVTLITPKGGKVLDPFNGSGSTGMAVKEFGGEYTGIDLDPNYIEIANKRIKAWK